MKRLIVFAAAAAISVSLSACGGNDADALAKAAIVDLCIGDPGANEAFCDCAAEVATGMMTEEERFVYGELYQRQQERGGVGFAMYSQYAEELNMETSQLRSLWQSANRKARQSPAQVSRECGGL